MGVVPHSTAGTLTCSAADESGAVKTADKPKDMSVNAKNEPGIKKAKMDNAPKPDLNDSPDNKTSVYAFMDKINFPREKYRLGHTKVFFRAAALAALEEQRDDVVLKLVRWMQGICNGYIKRNFVSPNILSS